MPARKPQPDIDDRQKLRLLRQTDLFRVFKRATLQQLAARCRVRTLTPGAVLFREGQRGQAMYLIHSGAMLIVRGGREIATLTRGQYLGEMALIDARPRSAAARAPESTVLLEIQRKEFRRYVAHEPAATVALMHTLADRIRGQLDTLAADVRQLRFLAHDMRNCLSPLVLVEEFLQRLAQARGGDGAEAQAALTRLTGVSEHLLHMLDQSLSEARHLQHGPAHVPTDLVSLARDTIAELARHEALRDKRVALDCRVPTLVCPVNPLEIRRVLQNLLINAGYATPKDGRIAVAVGARNNAAHIAITDTGTGVAAAVAPQLLRAPVSTRHGGTGLGLLSAREIIEERHGGRLWFEPNPAGGTVFQFTLPGADRRHR